MCVGLVVLPCRCLLAHAMQTQLGMHDGTRSIDRWIGRPLPSHGYKIGTELSQWPSLKQGRESKKTRLPQSGSFHFSFFPFLQKKELLARGLWTSLSLSLRSSSSSFSWFFMSCSRQTSFFPTFKIYWDYLSDSLGNQQGRSGHHVVCRPP